MTQRGFPLRHPTKSAELDPYMQAMPDRSPESIAFEAMWRGLDRDGLVPLRSAFLPEKASRLLGNIVLLEVNPATASAPMTTRIRLVGSAIRDLVDANITGLDYLDLVPDRDFQSNHLQICLSQPCAAWSASPVIYGRGYNALVESTNFPLIDDVTGHHLALVLMMEIGVDAFKHRSIHTPVELRPAIAKAFIDIGAGVPSAN